MKRTILTMLILALAVPLAVAQVVTTEEPQAPIAVPTIAAPVVVPTTSAPAAVPTIAAAPVQVVPPPVTTPPIASDVLSILINVRTDLEVLANQQLGGERPVGWSGSLDVNDPQLAILIRLDLELLMARLVGLENIPAGWFGAVPSTPYAIARDIRHDLELLADVMLGANIRPPGWAGDDPIMRCDRSTQNLVGILQQNGLYTPSVLPTAPDYCRQIAVQVGQFIEVNVLGGSTPLPLTPTPVAQGSTTTTFAGGGSAAALAGIGLAFLDRYATKRVGTIPLSETFQPVARSFTQFSRMTLVRGNGFEVFVDYATTNITEDQFNRLPNVNGYGAKPFCDAAWCTPVQIIAGIGSSRSTDRALAYKGLVSAGDNMVIHYDGEDRDGMTKVRMELCDRPTKTGQAICEPATSVILPDGTEAPSVGTINGLLQFFVPYQYTRTSVRSQNFYTADLWIDPPQNR